MPLAFLDLDSTQVADLSPLAGMPLESLNCHAIPATDFSPLALAREKLVHLSLVATSFKDLSVLEGMPLRSLDLYFCLLAEGFDTLARLKSLEHVILPETDMVSDDDIAFIDSLRFHPSLKSISFDGPNYILSVGEIERKLVSVSELRKMQEEILRLSQQRDYSGAAAIDRAYFGVSPNRRDWDFNRMLQWGMLLFADGNQVGYEEICREMVERFSNRAKGDGAAIQLCVLGQQCGIPIGELRRLLPYMGTIRKASPYRCWFVLTNGLVEYRAGRFPEAIELLSQMDTEIFPSALAAADSVLAMAYTKLEEHEAAAAHLEHARTMTKPRWSDPDLPTCNWRNWLYAHLLLQEAEKLMENSVSPTPGGSR